MEIIILLTLLFIAAEASYLVYMQARKTKHSRKQHLPIFVDTSVLIDGRILSIAQSGFITSTLFIPRSVIGELQFLADNADSDKRTRARHGLDVVNELQAIPSVKVEIFNDSRKAAEGVDDRLLSLAKEYNGAICTIDFNLNKVAQVESIPVLNVNDLAKTLRMAYLPGEKLNIELTQKGNDSHQAIGHLVDGTMVVVEHASASIGETVEVEFIRSLQTAAGKMMFAKLTTPAVKKPATKQPIGRQPIQSKQKSEQRAPDNKKGVVESKPSQKPVEKPVRQSKQQNTQQPQQAQTVAPRPQQQRSGKSRRPKTNEERLVELANQ